jgi:uncharacterized delta-60 repeat protein
MRTKRARKRPLVATGVVLTAAITANMLPWSTLAAPGDLDPGFGDSGRARPDLNGTASTVELLDDGTMILGGGKPATRYPFPWDLTRPFVSSSNGFVSRLTDSGATAPGFGVGEIPRVQVFDIARQPDGQVVAVGRTHRMTTSSSSFSFQTSQLVVIRLRSDGSIDSTFASDGIFALSEDQHGEWHLATAVVIDPDGRIVVAGTRGRKPIVLRLLPNGSFDDSFGKSGFVVGPDTTATDTDIVQTAARGYRLTSTSATAGCQLIALTSNGAIDHGFGSAGIATVGSPSGTSTYCGSMAAQTDGRLVVVGGAPEHAFAARFLPDGRADPVFSTASVGNAMSDATAVAIDADGRIAVAGYGVSGGAIMRLQANGEADMTFGNAGTTLIDLYSDYGSWPVPNDLKVSADGSIVVAGADTVANSAFVVRLLGESGGDSPGVLSITEQSIVRVGEGSEVALNIRRTGGSSGVVSVAYETSSTDLSPLADSADYMADVGRLTWADGDVTSQPIRIPVRTDTVVEDPEYFAFKLVDVQGGAGLGTATVITEIAADGSPHGQLALDDVAAFIEEGQTVDLAVYRQWYAEGEVSVTLTPIADTASVDADFTAGPVTLTWGHGETDWKYLTIPIVDDNEAEEAEQFRLELSNPTGGAILANISTLTVYISASDQPPSVDPPPEPAAPNHGGGGALGFLSLWLLGAASLFRRVGRVQR